MENADVVKEYLDQHGLRLEKRDGKYYVHGPIAPGPRDVKELEFLTGHRLLVYADSTAQVDESARTDKSVSSGDVPHRQTETLFEGISVDIVESLFEMAAARRSSDIHIEPSRQSGRVRFRMDGVMHTVGAIAASSSDSVVSRIKILAGLDIAEKRRPQDGRITMGYEGRDIDMRVSTLPTRFGEKIVLRLLDRSQDLLNLSSLGLRPRDLAQIRKALSMPHGMILVTGPTGSGKTTTLYASLQAVDYEHANVMTIEDPVEYEFAHINQAQVKSDIGFTFAQALRAFLRQDPDIIMVGEIRDGETADIAIRSALTGHLVLSTLHTNDAPSTISRLVDMGLERFLIASSLRLIIAQRLVRRVCGNCEETIPVDPVIKNELKLENNTVSHGTGCALCNGTGYDGRVALFEIMPVDEAISEAIVVGYDTARIRSMARETGMRSLRDAGRDLIDAGVTTPSEVLRETLLA